MITNYKGLELDPFQIEAINAINRELSVIVSAPTGTGKTLVADYLVEKSIQAGKKIIYTAPIKALSNQKFKDFSRQFGEEQVGIMTGDVVVNPTASLLIMTTEIFRNQVITNDPKLNDVSYVIFDEIHWLNDEDRGTVWEESIILAPENIKILGLSATIANAEELKNWIETIRKRKVALIEEQNRIVPLDYHYFTSETGLINYTDLHNYYSNKIQQSGGENHSQIFKPTNHIDLIKSIEKEYLPALFFVFSRKQCAEKAHELAYFNNYLNPNQSNEVQKMFIDQFGKEDFWSPSTKKLFRVCRKGVAYHHAGLLPSQKTIVEDLFLNKYISILYCTETFSVGINYPVKSVCFDSLRKYDGHNFRSLANHEFFQMSGRAGRRGIDDRGYSFALVDLNFLEKNPLPEFNINKLEPLSSQFKLSYNTVLNLMATLNYEQIQTFFKKSFAAHSYNVSSTEIYSEINHNTVKLKEMSNTLCHMVGTLKCPLIYYPKSKDFERLRKAYNRLEPRRKNKTYGRQMYHKIKKWDKILRNKPRDCSLKQQNTCKSLSSSYFDIQGKLSNLKTQLSLLPDHNTFLNEFKYKTAQLNQLNYIENDHILARGEIAKHIYVQEILVTELIFSGIIEQLDDENLTALISCVDYEPKKNDFFAKNDSLDFTQLIDIIKYIQGICGIHSVRFDSRVGIIAFFWAKGSPFSDIQNLCNLDEGDIVSIFRRTIDLMRQMRDATNDSNLKNRLSSCISLIDRDEASISDIY